MLLKETRKALGMTQAECAAYLGIPLRSYSRYESDESRIDPIRRRYIQSCLKEFGRLDEEHGRQTVDRIREVCGEVLPLYQAEFCYLFGSYAKGKETEKSDIDLLISVPSDGLRFFELAETLREKLNKRIDLLDMSQLNNNPALLREILKDGVKIYG